MDYIIEIIEKEAEFTLEVPADIPMWKMPVVIGKAYQEIGKYLENKNTKPSGPPFVRYLDVKWNEINKENKISAFVKMFTRKWKMVIGFPLANKIEGEKNLLSGKLQGGRYVKSIHRGAYQRVGMTYNKLLQFLLKENLNYKNESMEIYLNDPETTKEEDLETIVLIPLSD